MELLAAFVGILIGLPAGLWFMGNYRKQTKDYFSIPMEKRSEWMIEKKSDAIFKLFIFKFLIKYGLGGLIGIGIYLWHKFL